MKLNEYGKTHIHLIVAYHTHNEFDKTRIIDMDTHNYLLK